MDPDNPVPVPELQPVSLVQCFSVPPANLEHQRLAGSSPCRCNPGALTARLVGVAEVKVPALREIADDAGQSLKPVGAPWVRIPLRTLDQVAREPQFVHVLAGV